MTLYLKYRSKTLEELDLHKVRESLTRIVKSEKIPHAFLFSGPKGSGKTSAARILAKVVNCEKFDKKKGEPCNKCPSCISIARGDNLDVLEIDAASHRGIDDIRAVRDAVKLAPSSAKKKVYIVDEAHMLTTEASNALLKTLEEPPDHVIFILATTNPEKLIETIRSRTVNISFSKASGDEIVRALSRVAEGEKMKIDKKTLGAIAANCDGSFRDAIKIFEELIVGDVKLEKDAVEEYLLNNKDFDPEKFIEILKDNDEKSAYREIEKAVASGASIKNITRSVLERLRNILFSKVGILDEDTSAFSKEEILDLIGLISRSYSETGYAVLEQIPLELAVSEWFSKKSCESKTKSGSDNGITAKSQDKSGSETVVSKKGSDKKEDSVLTNDGEGIAVLSNGFDDGIWTRILGQIKPKNTSTEALLRAAKPVGFDGKTLTLGVYYKFHKEKLETNPHRSLLETVLQSVTGDNIRVICTLTDPPLKKKKLADSVQQVSENGEVSEETVLAEGEDEEIVRIAKEIFGS